MRDDISPSLRPKTLEEHRTAALRTACAIITDPGLCAARPHLRDIAWCVLRKARRQPCITLVPRPATPAHGEGGAA